MEQENEASTPEVRSCIVQGTMNLKKQKQNKQEISKKTITLKMEDGENGVEMQRINECAMIQIGRTVLFEVFPKSVKWQGTKRQVQGRSVSFPSNNEKRGVNCDEFMSQ